MLSGYKTYITGAVAIIAAVGAYLSGVDTIAQAGQLVFTAVLAMFVRNGVATGPTN